MGNLAFISSKKNLSLEEVCDELDEINQRRFGGFFGVFMPDPSQIEVGYHEGDEFKRLWGWSLQSNRKLGGKSPRPNYQWVEWVWTMFQAELGAKWGGRLSCEGVDGTWSPHESLDKTKDLATWIENYVSNIARDDDHAQKILQPILDQTDSTMPQELYRYAFIDPAEEMEQYVKDTFASFGAQFSFDPDQDLSKYRKGNVLTMGQLRAKKDGDLVWLYIYYKESVRANSAFRIKKHDGCWTFDDGSSFGADFDDDGRPDDIHAQNEWVTIHEAIPDKHGPERAKIQAQMQSLIQRSEDMEPGELSNELAKIQRKLARLGS